LYLRSQKIIKLLTLSIKIFLKFYTRGMIEVGNGQIFSVGDRVYSRSRKMEGTIQSATTIRTGGNYYTVSFPCMHLPVNLPATDLIPIPDPLKEIRNNQVAEPGDFVLKLWSCLLYSRYKSEDMSCLNNARVELLPHQIFVAHKATESFAPRFLLADEVGLGKTVEAGLILKELKARGLVKRILIIAPANLINQWEYELSAKFNEQFYIFDSTRIALLERDYPDKNVWTIYPQIIASLQLVRSDKHRQKINEAGWDLIIFDEAHHLRRYLEKEEIRYTKSYRLAEDLAQSVNSLLLLTATPLQLSSFELFSLVELLDPTLFGNFLAFEIYRGVIVRLANMAINFLEKGKGDLQYFSVLATFLEQIDQLLERVINDENGEQKGKPDWLIRGWVKITREIAGQSDEKQVTNWVKHLELLCLLIQLQLSGLEPMVEDAIRVLNEYVDVQYAIEKYNLKKTSELEQKLKQRVPNALDILIKNYLPTYTADELLNFMFELEKNELELFELEKNKSEMQKYPLSSNVSLIVSLVEALQLLKQRLESLRTLSLQISSVQRWELINRIFNAHKLSKVMIRNRRRRVLEVNYKRLPCLLDVEPTEFEQEVYQKVGDYVRFYYNCASDYAGRFVMVTFQRLLTSSFQALANALEKRKERLLGNIMGTSDLTEEQIDELSETLESGSEGASLRSSFDNMELQKIEELLSLLRKPELIDSKAAKVLAELEKIFKKNSNEKVLIYVQFIETQNYLAELLGQKYRVMTFNGKMNGARKDEAVARFRDNAQIMISTDAGGEGRNLQFCHIMINYDLPWNPMKIEQRIGRLDRIGQERDVYIYNLAIKGTVEARIVDALQNRIKIFEESVGCLDPILGERAEKEITELLMKSVEEFESWANDIELRIRQAREAEEKLADLIMDLSSFRKEKVDELLGRSYDPNLFRYTENLVINFLKRYPSAVVNNIAPGRWEIGIPEAFRREAKEILGISLEERRSFKTTFHPQIARQYEELDFVAFGHPLFDAIIYYCRKPYFIRKVGIDVEPVPFGLATAIKVELDVLSGEKGFLFAFEMEITGGLRTISKVLTFFVFLDGRYILSDDKEMRQLLSALGDFKFSKLNKEVPYLELENCYNIARQKLDEAVSNEYERWQKANGEWAELEIKRIDKSYRYRLSKAQQEMKKLDAHLEKIKKSGTDEEKKIIPAWQGRLKKMEEGLKMLEEEWKNRIQEVDMHRVVTPSWSSSPLCVAYIEFF